ncbi:MAG: hypothetical protein BWX60_01100 [Candidatus Marinimicrobia bacterium ADurb.Bin030]|nr:MAG: hypothetical protein BWX60_01100 [Candidatus Marinimicrobia bacterium ADurb.Bin030]
MNKKNLTELLGYEPGAELKRMILDDVKTSGLSIEECADKYAMPPQFIVGRGSTFEYNGETMTSEEFQRRFPYRRFVIIRTRE